MDGDDTNSALSASPPNVCPLSDVRSNSPEPDMEAYPSSITSPDSEVASPTAVAPAADSSTSTANATSAAVGTTVAGQETTLSEDVAPMKAVEVETHHAEQSVASKPTEIQTSMGEQNATDSDSVSPMVNVDLNMPSPASVPATSDPRRYYEDAENPWHNFSMPLNFLHIIQFIIMTPIAIARIILGVFVFVTFVAVVHVISIGIKDYSQPIDPWRMKIIIGMRFMARWVLFLYGFMWISVDGKNGAFGDKRQTNLIVSNHVSFLDVFYFLSSSMPSVVAKAGVQHICMVGRVARMLQCVWIERDPEFVAPKTHVLPHLGHHHRHQQNSSSPGSHASGTEDHSKQNAEQVQSSGTPSPAVVDSPSQHQHNKKSGASALINRVCHPHADKMYPVVIFPEGTTSNGRQLVKFHKGAFLCRVPVQPVVLQYKFWNCDPSFTDVPAFKTALRTIWSLYTVLKVTYLPVYYPSEEEIMNADLYAANVRHAMATAVNLKERDDSLSDKFAYLKIAAKDRRLPSC